MEEGEIPEEEQFVPPGSKLSSSAPKRPLPYQQLQSSEDAKRKYSKTFKVSYKRNFVGCSSLDDYRPIKKCGEGTFGQVFMAKNRKTGEVVAIKRLFYHKQEEDGFPITAMREIKYLKFLRHPNIISINEMVYGLDASGTDIDSFFVVFPYMDHDLFGLLGNPAIKFTTEQIKFYMVEILKGCAYLHSKKLIHRDIKTSNILLSNDGSVKLADFGLAQQYCEIRKEYTPGVVTQWYRPPELLLGGNVYTSAIDMWGIGCIFGEIFTRTPIFHGKTEIHQLTLIAELCGTISEETWPGVSRLPSFAALSLPAGRRTIRQTFSKYGESFADLLDSLLQLDPSKRLTAQQALNHPYFCEIPWPAKRSDLPKYQSMHEIDVKKATPRNSPLQSTMSQQPSRTRFSTHPGPIPSKRPLSAQEPSSLPKHRL